MSGVRLVVPVGDKRAFPWEDVRRALKKIAGMSFESLDIPALVAAGKKMGWSPAMIDHHWKMMANGRCFRFDQDDEPFVGGSLYEDNIFFSFEDGDHEAECRPIVDQIARSLGLEIREE